MGDRERDREMKGIFFFRQIESDKKREKERERAREKEREKER